MVPTGRGRYQIVIAWRRCVVTSLAPNALAGGRWLDIAPERIVSWLSAFTAGHGGAEVAPAAAAVRYTGEDGAIAECHAPFPPWPGLADATALSLTAGQPDEVAERIAAHASADRAVGVLIVRLGGYAAGVFSGAPPRLVASKTGSRLVHGRSAAGGTSQQRFARRREKQAGEALAAAAETAARVFEGYPGRLDAVVLGGDRMAIGRMRQDDRMQPYFDLAVDRFLTVPEPRLAVLRDTPRLFRAVRIRLIEPTPAAVAGG
ncbi:MAG TPA: acVLRF1 family peptidyl-tRNA hydrolase [Streptosporangiaceae bacterium]|nr:acVLRF1 family peptidyl-tRNA hydrolase [Streptosporangiaceae bacterium]